MIGQVGPGHVQGEDRGQVEKDTCHHPEGGFPHQVDRFSPGEKLPEIGQTGYNDNDALQGYGDIIGLSEIFPGGVLYKKDGEQADKGEEDAFDGRGLNDLEKKVRKYEQLKGGEEIIEDIHYIGLPGREGLVIQPLVHIRVYQGFDADGNEEIEWKDP
jgi:hypothetical protein